MGKYVKRMKLEPEDMTFRSVSIGNMPIGNSISTYKPVGRMRVDWKDGKRKFMVYYKSGCGGFGTNPYKLFSNIRRIKRNK